MWTLRMTLQGSSAITRKCFLARGLYLLPTCTFVMLPAVLLLSLNVWRLVHFRSNSFESEKHTETGAIKPRSFPCCHCSPESSLLPALTLSSQLFFWTIACKYLTLQHSDLAFLVASSSMSGACWMYLDASGLTNTCIFCFSLMRFLTLLLPEICIMCFLQKLYSQCHTFFLFALIV